MATAPTHLAASRRSDCHSSARDRWTLLTICRRIGAVARGQGLVALFFKILGELCYRRVRVYKEILPNDLHLPAATIPLVVRTLSEETVASFAAQADRVDLSEAKRRLAAGHLCQAAWAGAKLVGYVWSAPGRAPIDYLSVAMDLPIGAVYGYELFVLPEYRKAGVSIAMIDERRRLLREAGYDTGYSALMPENTAAVGFQRAVKRIPVGTMHTVWLGSWKRAWLRMDNPKAPQPFDVSH